MIRHNGRRWAPHPIDALRWEMDAIKERHDIQQHLAALEAAQAKAREAIKAADHRQVEAAARAFFRCECAAVDADTGDLKISSPCWPHYVDGNSLLLFLAWGPMIAVTEAAEQRETADA